MAEKYSSKLFAKYFLPIFAAMEQTTTPKRTRKGGRKLYLMAFEPSFKQLLTEQAAKAQPRRPLRAHIDWLLQTHP